MLYGSPCYGSQYLSCNISDCVRAGVLDNAGVHGADKMP